MRNLVLNFQNLFEVFTNNYNVNILISNASKKLHLCIFNIFIQLQDQLIRDLVLSFQEF
jgi:hypothetical protein